MVDRAPEQQKDLLELLGKYGPNRAKDGEHKIIDGIRSILDGSGLVVPTLEEVMALDQGKIAEIAVAHQAPATITKDTPEMEEWRRQTDRFIDLGFYDALKYSDSESYRLTIPKFFPKPRSWDGNFDKPLAVEERISLSKLHQLIGIKDYIDTSKITNKRRVPKKPYTVFIANSVETVTGTFDFAVGQLVKGGVLDTFIEIDMAYLRYPELFKTWLDAGDSRSGADSVPCLGVSGGRLGAGAHWWVGDPGGVWRLLSRGNKIGT